jgi:ATP-dependent DNA helicase RecG
MILSYLASHEEIANAVVRRLTGIGSENTVKRIFQRMIRAGTLESIPGRPLRDAAYRIPIAVRPEDGPPSRQAFTGNVG